MFTIGEFSKLCFISARMLRHYDSIGLLKPFKQDEDNRYRLYDISQLPTLKKINQLKRFDFTLEEIKDLLAMSEGEQKIILKKQLEILENKKNSLKTSIQELMYTINNKEDFVMNNYHVITMKQKSQNVLYLTRTVHVCNEDFHKLAKELTECLEKQQLSRTGPTQICYLDEEFNPEQANIEMQVEVSGTGTNIKTLPESLYVTVMHIGPLKHIEQAYEAILTWLSMHPEYKICGPSLERLICDEGMASDESKLQTAVMFPIKQIS